MRRAIFQCQQIQHVEEAAWDAYQWSDIHRELVDTHDVLHVKKKENVIEKIEQEAALLSEILPDVAISLLSEMAEWEISRWIRLNWN